jgi:cytochrome c-type biogenesis protein CcmH/NrfG
VRLGIATCCLKLGNTQKAELAYRRTLELSPDCTPALLGLAVLKLHASNEDEGVRDGSRLLAQAFACDPQDPFVLLLLAHFCLRQGFADKVRRLLPLLPAAACYRCCLLMPAAAAAACLTPGRRAALAGSEAQRQCR